MNKIADTDPDCGDHRVLKTADGPLAGALPKVRYFGILLKEIILTGIR